MKVLGVGVDSVEIEKVGDIVSGRFGNDFLNNNFTESEIRYIKSKKPAVSHIATTFAAKEAVFKALGIGWTGGKDIQVARNENGKPEVSLCGSLRNLAESKEILLSLSCNSSFAIAFAIIKEKE